MLPLHLHSFLLPITLLILQPCQASDPTSNPNGTIGFPNATKDIYGLGVRLGIYCQVLAFFFGFLNLLRLDVKSLFAGVILSWTLLIRWFWRSHDHDLSRPESWIAIALASVVTVPGIWLLRFVFRAQRRKLAQDVGDRAARRKIVEGQGLNIMLVVLSTFGVLAANVYFSFFIIRDQNPPSNGVTDKIWAAVSASPDYWWIRAVVGTQAVVTLTCLYPAIKYAGLWLKSLWYWFSPDEDPEVEAPSVWRAALRKRFEQWGLARRWLIVLVAIVFLAYSGFMVLTVELTIKAANLTPEKDLLGPGQLIPLVTGSFALLSSLADFMRRRGPNEIAPWDGPGRSGGRNEDEVPLRRWRGESGTFNQSGSRIASRESQGSIWAPDATYTRVQPSYY